jgi:hypothetical protein
MTSMFNASKHVSVMKARLTAESCRSPLEDSKALISILVQVVPETAMENDDSLANFRACRDLFNIFVIKSAT